MWSGCRWLMWPSPTLGVQGRSLALSWALSASWAEPLQEGGQLRAPPSPEPPCLPTWALSGLNALPGQLWTERGTPPPD